MSAPEPTESQVTALDGAVGELIHRDRVAGWLAIQVQPLRDRFLLQNSSCWILITWADGTVELEEDYAPFSLIAEMLGGVVCYEDRGIAYRLRWVAEDQRPRLWERYGIHESVGHYLALAARQRRLGRGS
ncbi:hypothetical protein EEW87_17715 (plasmid) [Janibacter melonis]|uniref:Uncharacterized protein n=1 Tax=Janibacter melonis TaxID=262209 RepID=A0A650GET1_9MICO|nr:hypothetical protein [Janibacter melonis]QGX08843.1 hypothetical protein EEW87_17715 [Janibacter melonis]